jgi:transcriptional regulator with XRE-family HTH domain
VPEKPRLQSALKEPFGTVVRKFRLERGLSQEALSFESGLDRSYLSEIERGLFAPSLAAIEALAGALGVRASELVKAAEEAAAQ